MAGGRYYINPKPIKSSAYVNMADEILFMTVHQGQQGAVCAGSFGTNKKFKIKRQRDLFC